MKINILLVLLVINVLKIGGMNSTSENNLTILGYPIENPDKLLPSIKDKIIILNNEVNAKEKKPKGYGKLYSNMPRLETSWQCDKDFCNLFKTIFPTSLQIPSTNLNHLLTVMGGMYNFSIDLFTLISQKINNHELNSFIITSLTPNKKFFRLINIINQIKICNVNLILSNNYHRYNYLHEHNALHTHHRDKKTNKILTIQKDMDHLNYVIDCIKEFEVIAENNLKDSINSAALEINF